MENKELKVKSNLTENMKNTDMLYWVGRRNAIKKYKEVLNNYRKIKEELNFIKLYKYAQNFNNSYIMKTIETEVM